MRIKKKQKKKRDVSVRGRLAASVLSAPVCADCAQRAAQFEETDFAGAPLDGRFSAITHTYARTRERASAHPSFFPPHSHGDDSHSNQRARAEHM